MRTVEQEIESLEAQLRELRELPAEPAIGAVVKFTKRLSGNTYEYAALHTEAGWYLTGRDGSRARTWKQLLDYAGKDAVLTVADGWYSLQVAVPRFYVNSISAPKVAKLTINPPADWYGPDDVSVPW